MLTRRSLAVTTLALALGLLPSTALAQLPFNDETAVVSRADGFGATADRQSDQGSISDDGRFVLFRSNATNLGGAPGAVYVRDLFTGQTRVVSKFGGEAVVAFQPVISGNGRFAFFIADPEELFPHMSRGYVYRADLTTDTIALVGREDGQDGAPVPTDIYGILKIATSFDGDVVAFESAAETIRQILRRRVSSAATTLVSKSDDGEPANASADLRGMSAYGNVILFGSNATNLTAEVPASRSYLRDLRQDPATTTVLGTGLMRPCGYMVFAAISANAKFAVANCRTSDHTADSTPYRYEFATGEYTRVTNSTYADGYAVSDDGRFVPFQTDQAWTLWPEAPGYSYDQLGIGDMMALLPPKGPFLLTRASGASGEPAVGESLFRDMTPDGSTVLLSSNAQNIGATTEREAEYYSYPDQLFVRRVHGNPDPASPPSQPTPPRERANPGTASILSSARLKDKRLKAWIGCNGPDPCRLSVTGKFEGRAKRLKQIRSGYSKLGGNVGWISVKIPNPTYRSAQKLIRRGVKVQVRVTVRFVGTDYTRTRLVRLK